MKENRKKNLIIISYWIAIGIMVWFSRDKEMPVSERLLSLICFCLISILISISFSKTLFRQTIRSKKTMPFIFKFCLMTFCMNIGLFFMYKLFCLLEYKSVFASDYYLTETLPFMRGLGQSIPGMLAANIIFCVILLYYEYSVLQKANLESRLKVLHAQINPHFMFNVLNYLHVLMQKDTDLASALLLKYSDTLRYQLYSAKKETVNLDREIRFLKDFIDVEKFRWEDKLDVRCTWIIEDPNKELPPLLFIPLIENAFKHVSRSTFNKGYITIFFEQKGNMISLEVENSKSDNAVKKTKSTGIGLHNLKARLEIHFGNLYSLTAKETDYTYTSKLIMFT